MVCLAGATQPELLGGRLLTRRWREGKCESHVRRRPERMETVKRSGVADLPLHGGRVPAWLADRMTQLGTAIVESSPAYRRRIGSRTLGDDVRPGTYRAVLRQTGIKEADR